MSDASGSPTTAVEATLRDSIVPLLRVHGGGIELDRVERGTVHLRFTDACTACKLRPLTLMAAVRPRLLAVPGVEDVQVSGVRVSSHVFRRFDELEARRLKRVEHRMERHSE